MKSSSIPLIAAYVNNDSAHIPPNLLPAVFITLLRAGWNSMHDPSLPDFVAPQNTYTMYVEGPNMGRQTDQVSIEGLWLDDVDNKIETLEGLPGSNDDAQPQYYLVVGSSVFCQAVAHYLATGQGGEGSNWGFHFIRRLTSAEEGQMVLLLDAGAEGPPQIMRGHFKETFDELLAGLAQI